MEVMMPCFGTFSPKHIHDGLNTIELANFLAVGIFNDGFQSILKIFQIMGVIIGPTAKEYVVERLQERVEQLERKPQRPSRLRVECDFGTAVDEVSSRFFRESVLAGLEDVGEVFTLIGSMRFKLSSF